MCMCFFGSQNVSSNSDCCHGGGVQDPEIVIGDEQERRPENSNKDGIRTYGFLMAF